MGWIDWLRYVLTPLLVAVLGATIATRNARKTPHERLKNLVDIHDKMPAGLDHDNVVETAIARELVDFDRRMAAAQRGLLANIKERLVQLNPALTILLIPITALVIICAVALIGGRHAIDQLTAGGAIASVISGVVTLVGAIAAFFATRDDRKQRAEQQDAAVRFVVNLTREMPKPPDDPPTTD
ncbi:hypothetical protein ACQ7HM_20900 [Williamsia sp. MIQD14]|uniref:hypothetical protein n=1 Tax=Williamsia sp. MIQD14 TaxID=3425703 RepID=UPI003DA1461F